MMLNGEDDRAISRWRDPEERRGYSPSKIAGGRPEGGVAGVIKLVITDPPTGVQCGCAFGDCAAAAEPGNQSAATIAARTKARPACIRYRLLSLIPPSLV